MKESVFYNLCEKAASVNLPSDLINYFPTVDEINDGLEEATVEDLAPSLLWLARDPYKNNPDVSMLPEYQRSVKYAIELTTEIEIDELDAEQEDLPKLEVSDGENIKEDEKSE